MDRYPQQSADVQVGTVAFHAERELDGLMYQDTGMYLSGIFQFEKSRFW